MLSPTLNALTVVDHNFETYLGNISEQYHKGRRTIVRGVGGVWSKQVCNIVSCSSGAHALQFGAKLLPPEL